MIQYRRLALAGRMWWSVLILLPIWPRHCSECPADAKVRQTLGAHSRVQATGDLLTGHKVTSLDSRSPHFQGQSCTVDHFVTPSRLQVSPPRKIPLSHRSLFTYQNAVAHAHQWPDSWFLHRFLPRLTKTALEEELEDFEIIKPDPKLDVEGVERALTCKLVCIYLPMSRCNVMCPIYQYRGGVLGQKVGLLHEQPPLPPKKKHQPVLCIYPVVEFEGRFGVAHSKPGVHVWLKVPIQLFSVNRICGTL